MNDPERLIDGPLDADIAELLRSADRDTPPAPKENRHRIFAAAASNVPWAAGPSAASKRRLYGAVAWTGLAVMVIGAGVGFFASRGTEKSVTATYSVGSTTMTAATAAAEPAEAKVDVAPPKPTTAPSMRVDELPSVATAVAASAITPSASVATGAVVRHEAARSVDDELAMISAAQSALTAKRPQSAVAEIARYRSTFSSPHFSGEADAIEVQALAALGRSDEARKKAERFLSAHPNSPYTQRVRSAAGMVDGAGAH